MKKTVIIFSLFSCLSLIANDKTLVFYGKKAESKVKHAEILRVKSFTNVPNYVKFKRGKELPFAKLKNWLNQFYETNAKYGLQLLSQDTDKLGMTHYRYRQTIDDIPVELSMYLVHTKNNFIQSVNGELFSDISVSTKPSLTEEIALANALNYIGAATYKWEISEEENHLKWRENDPSVTYLPKGELVIVNKGGVIDNELVLAYKFNIYAQEPLSRSNVFVDAKTGDIVWEKNLIFHADVTGTANTMYSGGQTITCDNTGGNNHRLQETGRGNGIRTFTCNNTTNYSNTDITNTSNNWTTTDAALDAHWGAEITYDYFMNEHGRNSIDNNGFQLTNYVHYGANYTNAFWDGFAMTYGDGSGSMTSFTVVDIVGHEITHGLTSYTSDLIPQGESGALNESFSDIFGVSIDFMNRPNIANWKLGDDIGVTIRNMANPNSVNHPDTYLGNFWDSSPNPHVHLNGGVQNFWYTLLVDGGTGTNDNNDTYTINSIGSAKAEQITFRNLTVYLTPTSEYFDARFFAILSTIDLYGGCSLEVQEVTNAWYAVGVGSSYTNGVEADFSAQEVLSCNVPFTVAFNNQSINGISYNWDFGDGNSSTQFFPNHTYLNNGTYSVKLVVDGGICGKDSLTKTAYITIDSMMPCMVNMPTTGTAPLQTECSGILYDSGGANGQYGSNEDALIIIAPPSAASIDLNFLSFSIDSSFSNSCDNDYLEIYDGYNISAPLIGKYCNNNIPVGTISSSGGAVTIVFHSDVFREDNGFELEWQCNYAISVPEIENLEGILSHINDNGDIIVDINNLTKGNYNLSVLNALGQVVVAKQVNVTTNQQKELVTMPNQAKGMYFINLYNDTDQYTVKLVK